MSIVRHLDLLGVEVRSSPLGPSARCRFAKVTAAFQYKRAAQPLEPNRAFIMNERIALPVPDMILRLDDELRTVITAARISLHFELSTVARNARGEITHADAALVVEFPSETMGRMTIEDIHGSTETADQLSMYLQSTGVRVKLKWAPRERQIAGRFEFVFRPIMLDRFVPAARREMIFKHPIEKRMPVQTTGGGPQSKTAQSF